MEAKEGDNGGIGFVVDSLAGLMRIQISNPSALEKLDWSDNDAIKVEVQVQKNRIVIEKLDGGME